MIIRQKNKVTGDTSMCCTYDSLQITEKAPEKGKVKNEKEVNNMKFFNTFPGGYAPETAQSAPPASTMAPHPPAKSRPSPRDHPPSSAYPSNPSSYSSNHPSSSASTPLFSSLAYTAAAENSEPLPLPLQHRQQARLSPVRRYFPGVVRGLFLDACGGYGRTR